jgi:hypothetical protein
MTESLNVYGKIVKYLQSILQCIWNEPEESADDWNKYVLFIKERRVYTDLSLNKTMKTNGHIWRKSSTRCNIWNENSLDYIHIVEMRHIPMSIQWTRDKLQWSFSTTILRRDKNEKPFLSFKAEIECLFNKVKLSIARLCKHSINEHFCLSVYFVHSFTSRHIQ